MSNIISSDFYRVRRGAALRNTFIGMALVVLFMIVMAFVSQMDGFTYVESGTLSVTEASELTQDLTEVQQEAGSITGGAALASELLGQSLILFFFLPIALAVFCADFSAGTHHNTLSYESNRVKVYMAKLLLTIGLSLALVLAMVLFCWLSGGIAFGLGGFSWAYVQEVLLTILLQLPVYLSIISICHCLIAITRKSSVTIAIFIVGLLAFMLILQYIAQTFPDYSWLLMLDPQNGGKLMANREMASTGDLIFVAAYNLGLAAAATLLGSAVFRKADMP